LNTGNCELPAVRAIGIESIICLCTEDQIHLYPGATLIEFYEVAGFHVRHIPVEKGRRPPLNQRQLEACTAVQASIARIPPSSTSSTIGTARGIPPRETCYERTAFRPLNSVR
jgi:hypothetical protein